VIPRFAIGDRILSRTPSWHQVQPAACGFSRTAAKKLVCTSMATPSKESIILAGVTFEGVSVGGQETCIILPQYKVAFDIGRCPQRAVNMETILFSHCHLDHISGIAAYVGSRSMLSLRPPRMVVPKPNAAGIDALMEAYRVLDTSDLPYELVPSEVGDEIDFPNRNMIARVFRTYHVVPSQGYLLCSQKKKLKQEYLGLPGSDIKALRDEGVEVCDVVEVPEVAFTGDTTSEWITDPANQDVLRAKLLFMEVTFLDDTRDAQDAQRFGHTHISEVVENAHLFQNQAIVFIHFSARFKIEEIERHLDERLPPSLRHRVTPLLAGFSRSSSSPASKSDGEKNPKKEMKEAPHIAGVAN